MRKVFTQLINFEVNSTIIQQKFFLTINQAQSSCRETCDFWVENYFHARVDLKVHKMKRTKGYIKMI